MTITVIIPTGETRQAKMGEYYQTNDKQWHLCYMGPTEHFFPIGIRHEVEISDEAGGVNITPTVGRPIIAIAAETTFIPIPRPKKKIKKHVEGWIRLLSETADSICASYIFATKEECERKTWENGPIVFVSGEYEVDE